MQAGILLLFGAIMVWLAATGKFAAILNVIKNQSSQQSPNTSG